MRTEEKERERERERERDRDAPRQEIFYFSSPSDRSPTHTESTFVNVARMHRCKIFSGARGRRTSPVGRRRRRRIREQLSGAVVVLRGSARVPGSGWGTAVLFNMHRAIRAAVKFPPSPFEFPRTSRRRARPPFAAGERAGGQISTPIVVVVVVVHGARMCMCGIARGAISRDNCCTFERITDCALSVPSPPSLSLFGARGFPPYLRLACLG